MFFNIKYSYILNKILSQTRNYTKSASLEKATPKQEAAVGALVTANQNLIDLIARRYSSPSGTLAEAKALVNANSARKTSASDVALKIPEKYEEQPNSQSPTTPSNMLNKLSPGNIFKNIFK